ncbi:MAG: S9 family peptidase [Acidobacteria bacterium]|nr:S9 family peptidase [Acidobacteriota bacterium]
MQTRLVLLALLCLPVVWGPAAWGQTSPVWTPELSMQVDTIGEVVPSPDGRWVAYTRTTAVMEEEKSEMVTQIHVALADGTRRLQLTRGEKSASSPAFTPDGGFVYFVSSRSGERNIWRIAVSGGEAERITDWEGSIGGFRVSPDGSWLAFTGRKKKADIEKAKKQKRDFRVIDEDAKNNGLWMAPSGPGAQDRTPRQLVDGTNHITDFEWSPDSRKIVFEHQPRNEPDHWMQADISEIEVANKTVKKVAADEVSERSPKYSPDGKLLAYLRSSTVRNWAGEGRFIVKDLSTGKQRTLALTHDEGGRGTNLLGFSADSKRVLFTETQGVRNVLVGMDLDGKPRNLGFPETGALASNGGGSRLNATGTHIGAAAESLTKPVEAYVFDVKSGKATKSSDAHGNLTLPPLGMTEVIRWKSKDGMEIEGLLTYPVSYKRGARAPLVLEIHGGPMGVFTETFIGARGLYPRAAFASEGYAVLRPNPRGSSGYGLAFRTANMNDWGGGDYEDIMSGVDHVIEMGVADPDRMVVMGWSYGGFMTSWVVGQTDRFKAACVGAAVTNLWSFTGTSDILDFLPGYFKGEPWENFEGYRKHSPMNYVQNVKTPSLVLHGEEDLRVPISQGYEFYNALKRRGVKTQMVVYPRTPHGPTEPKFLLDVAKRHLAWTEEHLAK